MLKRVAINKSVPNKYCRSVRERHISDWLVNKGYRVDCNNKSILKDRELDIYLPDHNIAFEFNGIAYHWTEVNGQYQSGRPHPKNYHRLKTIDCLNQGIALYHFWDFESISSVKFQILEILRGKILSLTNADKNPFIVHSSVLVPLFYIAKDTPPYSEGVTTRMPTIWKTTRNSVYKFYNAGFVLNKLIDAAL